MSNSKVNFSSETKGDWIIWTISGSVDMTTAAETEKKGREIVENNSKVALDMSQLEYISSAGLRVLLILTQMAEDEEKEFAICGAKGDVKDVLEDSGMDVLLNLNDSLSDVVGG